MGLGQKEEGKKVLNLALNEINQVLVETPDYYFGRDTRVQILLSLGRSEEALALARENRAVKSQQQDALQNLTFEETLISALAANGNLDEAMTRLDVYLSYPVASSLGLMLKLPGMPLY